MKIEAKIFDELKKVLMSFGDKYLGSVAKF
ncbi:hypothetical protein Si124_01758 [Streptococcus infantarius subsp. infantarius]|nr:hypothetical protein [Streptococcus infantarius subsp. infantarius]MCO4502701.1 hypothetical protein [Streptococcus infantarius subsp. infantarius]